jgi:hypothetical protein
VARMTFVLIPMGRRRPPRPPRGYFLVVSSLI